MIKSLSIAGLAALLAIAVAGVTIANEPIVGQSTVQTAPCPGQSSPQVGADTSITTMKPQQEANAKSSAAEAAQKAMSNVKKADTVDTDTLRNPEARSSAETRLEASANPCLENSGMIK